MGKNGWICPNCDSQNETTNFEEGVAVCFACGVQNEDIREEETQEHFDEAANNQTSLRARMAASALAAVTRAEKERLIAAGEDISFLQKKRKEKVSRTQIRTNLQKHLKGRYRSARSMLVAYQDMLRHMTVTLVDKLQKEKSASSTSPTQYKAISRVPNHVRRLWLRTVRTLGGDGPTGLQPAVRPFWQTQLGKHLLWEHHNPMGSAEAEAINQNWRIRKRAFFLSWYEAEVKKHGQEAVDKKFPNGEDIWKYFREFEPEDSDSEDQAMPGLKYFENKLGSSGNISGKVGSGRFNLDLNLVVALIWSGCVAAGVDVLPADICDFVSDGLLPYFNAHLSLDKKIDDEQFYRSGYVDPPITSEQCDLERIHSTWDIPNHPRPATVKKRPEKGAQESQMSQRKRRKLEKEGAIEFDDSEGDLSDGEAVEKLLVDQWDTAERIRMPLSTMMTKVGRAKDNAFEVTKTMREPLKASIFKPLSGKGYLNMLISDLNVVLSPDIVLRRTQALRTLGLPIQDVNASNYVTRLVSDHLGLPGAEDKIRKLADLSDVLYHRAQFDHFRKLVNFDKPLQDDVIPKDARGALLPWLHLGAAVCVVLKSIYPTFRGQNSSPPTDDEMPPTHQLLKRLPDIPTRSWEAERCGYSNLQLLAIAGYDRPFRDGAFVQEQIKEADERGRVLANVPNDNLKDFAKVFVDSVYKEHGQPQRGLYNRHFDSESKPALIQSTLANFLQSSASASSFGTKDKIGEPLACGGAPLAQDSIRHGNVFSRALQIHGVRRKGFGSHRTPSIRKEENDRAPGFFSLPASYLRLLFYLADRLGLASLLSIRIPSMTQKIGTDAKGKAHEQKAMAQSIDEQLMLDAARLLWVFTTRFEDVLWQDVAAGNEADWENLNEGQDENPSWTDILGADYNVPV